MKTVNFDLKDADGVGHRYKVELFSCDESIRLQLIVVGPLMETLGAVIAAALPAVSGKKIADVLKDLDTAASALQKINWGQIPGALTAIPKMIEARGGAKLIAQIFAKTNRLLPIGELQGVPTASGDGDIDSDFKQHLALPDQRDAAFGDGNYQELWTAVAMVLIVNFTRSGRNGSGSSKGIVETLTGGLWTPSTATTETPPPSSGSRSDKTPPTG